MSSLAVVDKWTERLTGFSANFIKESRKALSEYGVDHLDRELCMRPDLDSAAGACMLRNAVNELEERGIPKTKMIAKLRGDPDIWAAATELIAVASIAKFVNAEARLELDANRGQGPNADLRLSIPEYDLGESIEFKAVGLSDSEVAFFRRASKVLPAMCPAFGVGAAHIAFDNDLPLGQVVLTRSQRRQLELENRRRAKHFPAHIRDLNAATLAAHYTEQHYLERVRPRIVDAIRQLPTQDTCWVALWWSNGAPALSVKQMLTTIDLPKHILGVILVGAAVVPPVPEVHYYVRWIHREEIVPMDAPLDEVVSLNNHPLARRILLDVESATGVRPTVLLDPSGPRTKRKRVLFRDGSRRIFPFNLLLTLDPEGAREACGAISAD